MASLPVFEDAVLIGVDPQNDFCPEGSLPVPDGDSVMSPLNAIRQWVLENNGLYFLSRDWHPPVTTHFEKWPIHCVQGTNGARFHPELNTERAIVFSKGMGVTEDAYSAFDARSGDISVEEFLNSYNRRYKIALIVGGLATDYCVRQTVLDARQLGFETYLLTDAIRAVDLKVGDGERAIAEMTEAGATLSTSHDLVAGKVINLRPR